MPDNKRRPVYLVVKPLAVVENEDGDEEEAVAIIDMKQSRLAADMLASTNPEYKVIKRFIVS